MIQVDTIITDFGKHGDHDDSINAKIAALEEDGHTVYGVHFEYLQGVSSGGKSVGIRLLGHILFESERKKKEE